jgi:glycosyltransferase involved in cell wall biosynthesis
MRVLFFARQAPLPLDNGGRNRTFHLARELSARSSLYFLAYNTQPGSRFRAVSVRDVEDLLPQAERIHLVEKPRRSKRLTQLLTTIGGESSLISLHRSEPMRRALADAITHFRPDVVHVDNELLAPYAECLPVHAARVVAPHNIESDLYRRLAFTQSFPRSQLYRREARTLRCAEEQYIPMFDMCVVVSPQDAAAFEELSARCVVCVPNGASPRPAPEKRQPLLGGEVIRLVFVGVGDYQPNRDAVQFFRSSVLPLLSDMPVRVAVVGARWQPADFPELDFLGHVPDLAHIYDQAHAAVVPVRAGGGTRLKVVDALAFGVPLIATSIGAEGIGIRHGVHGLIADDEAGFARAIRQLVRELREAPDKVYARRLAGYELASKYFWPKLGEQLASHYSELACRRRSGDV